MSEVGKVFVEAIPAIITGIIAAVSTWFVARTNKKGSREINLINELQEEIGRLTKRIDEQDSRIRQQDANIQILLQEKLVDQEYITILRQHIHERKGPPPPDFLKGVEK